MLWFAGINLIDGGYGLQIYTLAQSKDVKDGIYDQHIIWGLQTLFFAWGHGIVRVIFLAKRRDWGKMTRCQGTIQILCYVALVFIWPVFSVLL